MMPRHLVILGTAAAVVALPFVFRQPDDTFGWQPRDPVLIVITPHNEAIRYEFARAFSQWHQHRFGRPAKVDWRVIGGTTEIMRYLTAQTVAAFRARWMGNGKPWPPGGADAMLDSRFGSTPPPGAADAGQRVWEQKRDLWQTFRNTDDPNAFSSKVDLFFGGGTYDHGKAFQQGLTVPPWPRGQEPPETVRTDQGAVLVPERLSGEIWRTEAFFGTALSAFGIVYNADRLRELGIRRPPARWTDLTDPAYFRQVGLADPTKSGSIAKAFEMIVHQQCRETVRAAGYDEAAVARFETAIGKAGLSAGEMPDGVPAAYQEAVQNGWLDGIRLIQRISANGRYFTDSASKVPIDVSVGDAAAGIAIDFFGRYQAEMSRAPDGRERMVYVTPAGGSGVSADPISLMRGAEHRELAVRFIEFTLSEDGQRLWNQAPGTPGGPRRFALRRLPIRRDFYPSDDPELRTRWERHRSHAVDALHDPGVNPYELARQFEYSPRWTAAHFNAHRDLIRAMCIDSGDELRAAWSAILAHGGPDAQPGAMSLLERMPDRPEPLTWRTVLTVQKRFDRLDYLREWTCFFRASYAEARRAAEPGKR